MIITKLREVDQIANKMFKCVIMPVAEIHGKGYMGIKLIVGEKPNPAFDPSLDPNDIKLTEGQKARTKNTCPDVRIIWMPPGTSEVELIEGYLKGIEKSLKEKKPIQQRDSNLTKISEVSDADIAAKIARGENVDSRYEDFADGYEDENEKFPANPNANKTETSATKEEVKEDGRIDELVEAIKKLAVNTEVLNENVNLVTKTVEVLEKKVDTQEKKLNKKK